MNELYELFLIALTGLSFAPLAFFWGACPCCGSCTVVCDGGVNSTFTVVVDGVADDYCADCESYNGTWVLSDAGFCNNTSNGCAWHYQHPSSTMCGYSTCVYLWAVNIAPITDFKIRVVLQHLSFGAWRGDVIFENNYGSTTKPTCSSFSSESISFLSNESAHPCSDFGRNCCDGSGATCEVSA